MKERYYLIGETAGKIYRSLEGGPKTVEVLEKEIQVKELALFHQAIGWLARESKIDFQGKGKKVELSLVNSDCNVCS